MMRLRWQRWWRRGETDRVDLLTVAIIAVMVIAAVVAIFRLVSDMAPAPPSRVSGPYGQLLTCFDRDCKQAVEVQVSSGSDGLTLKTLSGATVRYQLKNAELSRVAADGAEIPLVKGVKKAVFVQANPRLLQIYLAPAESARLPFFTSVALRGAKR